MPQIKNNPHPKTPPVPVAEEGTSSTTEEINLVTLKVDGINSNIQINVPILLGLLLIGVLLAAFIKIGAPRWLKNSKIGPITLNIPFGIGSLEVTPNYQEKLIAHKIWTELVTRKAALPFERDKDVIVEVYNSWYTLFGIVRQLISEVPVEKLHGPEKDSIEHLIYIALNVLNDGLRPHLTQWQAKFRAWHDEQDPKGRSPQEIQKDYDNYDELVKDIKSVNKKLVGFANDLKTIVTS